MTLRQVSFYGVYTTHACLITSGILWTLLVAKEYPTAPNAADASALRDELKEEKRTTPKEFLHKTLVQPLGSLHRVVNLYSHLFFGARFLLSVQLMIN